MLIQSRILLPGYPIPVKYQNQIGEQIRIFSTEFKDSQTFPVVTPGVPVRNNQKMINRSDSDPEKRLTALEQTIHEIKEFCSEKAAKPQSGGFDQEYGTSRIQTGDIHR